MIERDNHGKNKIRSVMIGWNVSWVDKHKLSHVMDMKKIRLLLFLKTISIRNARESNNIKVKSKFKTSSLLAKSDYTTNHKP